MKARLQKLLAVKSIVTLLLTVVFCILSLRGSLDPQYFLAIFTTVIAFYFGTQAKKEDSVTEEGK